MPTDIPTVNDIDYAVKVLKEEQEFCDEQGDTPGGAMLGRVIETLVSVREPLGKYSEAMARGESPMQLLVELMASMNSQGEAGVP